MSEENRPVPFTPLSEEDLAALEQARQLLENPGLTARLATTIGSPIENALKRLPGDWAANINTVVRRSLFKALEIAASTLGQKAIKPASDMLHKGLVGLSGGLGGGLGFVSMALELPVSTTIMLRSIADIARSEGFDINAVETKLNCLQVFALGGRNPSVDPSESGYWASRAAMGTLLNEAARHLAANRAVDRTAPAILRFVSAIASRFGVVVSEQAAAKALPVVGAATGATINVMFMEHFQQMAKGHFAIKRLEAKYGQEAVQSAYAFLAKQAPKPPPVA